ncbi:hypothetical protein COX47_03920 [Candidatus Roizmanbacteria bacterium CG23_combo_of_CG06-09_8_20_14_all_35_49]|uniref:Type II secretion system protein GspG C-terminal domain-containing protein n=1 Tax=Candidatus Roizmanbacteria bacterium CG23_combo_of_CG06-09_8_20_14_all_35_49 TaxID=1974863 RepID=A0A2G9Y611_9BACT|nr:MAG: hypothetical protein COX47_03920 [Candidatus Roizmanbacteria bacterium CG23_combo_of_CG06-09_8_20_14_all_35_49]
MPKKALAHRSFGQVGFTLMELLIVIAIIAILATIAIVLLNPMQQISKAQDGRRKNDLATFQKVLEDYYNDKGCYPRPNEVCYPTVNQAIIPMWIRNAISAVTNLHRLISPIFLLIWLVFPAIPSTQPINIFIK